MKNTHLRDFVLGVYLGNDAEVVEVPADDLERPAVSPEPVVGDAEARALLIVVVMAKMRVR